MKRRSREADAGLSLAISQSICDDRWSQQDVTADATIEFASREVRNAPRNRAIASAMHACRFARPIHIWPAGTAVSFNSRSERCLRILAS